MTEDPFLMGDLIHAIRMRAERSEPLEAIEVGSGVLDVILNAVDATSRPVITYASPMAGPIRLLGVPVRPSPELPSSAWRFTP